MNQNFINYQWMDQIVLLELDDPSANTLTFDLFKELEERLLEIASNDLVKGLILTGKGDKFFSGGVNIGMLLTAGQQHNSHFILYAVEVLQLIESLDIPVVSIINGNITGGGLELALIANHRIAVAGDYNIGFPEVRLGVIPGMGGTQRLSRLIGAQRALELITQGAFVSPQQALSLGLVDEVLPVENFRALAIEQARQFIISQGSRSYGMPTAERPLTLSSSRFPPSTQALSTQAFSTQPISAQEFSAQASSTAMGNFERLLDRGFIELQVHNGLATITFNEGADDYSYTNLLAGFNRCLIEVRVDETVYCLLIKLNAASLGIPESQKQCSSRLRDYVLKKLINYPRIVAITTNHPMDPMEFELGLCCDYRFVPDSFATISNYQNINSSSPNLDRFRGMLPSGAPGATVSDLVASGFFKAQDAPEDWLQRFIPPRGAGQAIGYAKLAIAQGFSETIAAGLLLERHLQEQLFSAPDSKEGMQAYLEKRKPFFVGMQRDLEQVDHEIHR